MSGFTDARQAAPTAFQEREVRRALRRALRAHRMPTPREMKSETRRARLARAPFLMNGRLAAWALVVEPRLVTAAIRDGRLPAEREQLDGGRFRYRILRSDLARFAETLA